MQIKKTKQWHPNYIKKYSQTYSVCQSWWAEQYGSYNFVYNLRA